MNQFVVEQICKAIFIFSYSYDVNKALRNKNCVLWTLNSNETLKFSQNVENFASKKFQTSDVKNKVAI